MPSTPADPLVEAAIRLRPLIERDAAAAAGARRLTPAVADAMREAGILSATVPRDFGGAEADPIAQIRIIEAVAYADCSAGWCASVAFTCGGLSGGYASARAAAEIAPDGVWPVFAGSFGPVADAKPVSGGYRLNGRWGFISGVHYSPWLILAAHAGDTPLFTLIPKSAATVEDTWHAAGLEATGSTHVHVEDLFVPEHMTTRYNAPWVRGGPLYRAPMAALLGPGTAGCYLGAAQRALDEVTAVAAGKTRYRRARPIGARESFQRDLGIISTKLRAARLVLVDTLGECWADVLAGREVPVAKFAAFQAANTHAFHVATEVAAFAFEYAGIAALMTDSPLQKIRRDIMAVGQHTSLANENYEFGGRGLLGTAEHIFNTQPRPKA
jgi:alkylation response protein AidB-like acyl-CoA dehydrogenase